MNFTSYIFFAFLIVVFLGYFLLPKKARWVWLLLCSYAFYAYTGWYYLAFLLYSTLVTFLTGLWLGHTETRAAAVLAQTGADWSRQEKKAFNQKTARKKRGILLVGLLLNLGMLIVLKYFLGSLNNLLTQVWQLAAPGHVIGLVFPLGVSFYTFQSTGYLLDCYRGTIQPDRNLAKYALFVSFFPQLIQGPIARHNQLAAQLYEHHSFDYTRVKHGLELVLWGYFKKVVIADRVGVLVATVVDDYTGYAGSIIFVSILFYALQLYADFSGGIDVARGVGQVLGIQMAENFKRPFFSTSLNEFWQRWHITLGGWFRDYVFYPIAVSKVLARFTKKIRKRSRHLAKVLPNCIASFVSFLLLGIWHGSQWKYVAFGLYYGVLISLSTLLKPAFDRLTEKLHIRTDAFSWRLLQSLRTIFCVLLGLYFIRGGSFLAALSMLKRTFTAPGFIYLWNNTILTLGLNWANLMLVFCGALIMLAAGILQERGIVIREALDRQNLWLQWTLLLLGLFAVLIYGVYGTGYDAASFIYETF